MEEEDASNGSNSDTVVSETTTLNKSALEDLISKNSGEVISTASAVCDAELPSDEEIFDRMNGCKKRKNIFSYSEDDKTEEEVTKTLDELSKDQSNSDEDDLNIFQKNALKSRIKAMSSSDDERDILKPSITMNSDSDTSSKKRKKLSSFPSRVIRKGRSSSSEDEITKELAKPTTTSDSSETETHLRLKNKRTKMSQKFKSLISSRNLVEKKDENLEKAKTDAISDSCSDAEESSIEKIKQKIKERSNHLKSTIYDPDTSDDELAYHVEGDTKKMKLKSKESHKPVRMSAKQAMENMHKIKSESNRMLREKEVSLPYHRPKALNLKDILSRKRPALSADGQALPLKMNEDQLRQYAKQLEERQKEMIELCKSESEDEADLANPEDVTEEKLENSVINKSKSPDKEINKDQENIDSKIEDSKDISQTNDELFDTQTSKANETSLYETANEDSISGIKSVENNVIDSVKEKPNTVPESQLISLKYNSEKVTEEPMAETDDNLNEDNTCNELNLIDGEENNKNKTQNDNESNIEEFEQVSKSSEFLKDQPLSNRQEMNGLENQKEGSEGIVQNTYIEETFAAIDKSITEEKQMDVSEDQDILKSTQNSNNDISSRDIVDGFSDDEMDMDDIDKMIENADIIVENATQNDAVDSPMLIRDLKELNSKPKLTGAPGMVIDLDGTDAMGPNKLSGIELLKERFIFFAQLKTPEEMERQTKNRVKPGIQHLKLKQELEEQIAEQRSLEWHKRLEEEKQQQAEMNAIRGDESDENDIEKIEAQIDETEENNDETESESEPEENDIVLEDKPTKKNALVDDEAEESDIADGGNEADDEAIDNEAADDQSDDGDESSEDSSDDELETDKPKKGRIIQAFEDSDDDLAEEVDNVDKCEVTETERENVETVFEANKSDSLKNVCFNTDDLESQDVELNSAQLQKSISEDIFASQDSEGKTNTIEKIKIGRLIQFEKADKMHVICETQPYDNAKFDEIAGMCSGSFTQNANTLPVELTQNFLEISESSQNKVLLGEEIQTKSLELGDATQTNIEIGDNILNMCTGKFYDNHFVSQDSSEDKIISPKQVEKTNKTEDGKLLQSILLELDDPEFDKPKTNKFFTGGSNSIENQNEKKRFVIDSDDEEEKRAVIKKKRRRKLEDRALQISDDEDELLGDEEEEFISGDEDNAVTERLVEYDSEENEVELALPQKKKVKRKTTDFFEQEAELTSEDEWVGSGDEDEAGLDRMEREEGDDDTFHQGALRRQLGQIHMRDLMDQDKREVRLLQELLLEDGELGGGSRQRKFRWRNADGVEETGTNLDEFGDTQEDEFESEEQWRKERHERAVFLRQMMKEKGEEEDSINVSFNRSALIKASLNRTANNTVSLEPTNENQIPRETKTLKDVPSPVKQPFSLLQKTSFRGGILSRGSGALARLGALAAPLADEKLRTKTGPGSFVFAAKEPDEKPKVTKRKADGIIGTPNLMKKLKTEEKRKITPNSRLLDHFNT